jgi:hypothetical protein
MNSIINEQDLNQKKTFQKRFNLLIDKNNTYEEYTHFNN